MERNYKDLTNKIVLALRSDSVEKLTQDSFIVQVERITNRYQTRLGKLLSVFEQTNFVDDKKIMKEFKHDTYLEEVKILTDILHHSGTNTEEKKKIETEQEAWRIVNAMFNDKEKSIRMRSNGHLWCFFRDTLFKWTKMVVFILIISSIA